MHFLPADLARAVPLDFHALQGMPVDQAVFRPALASHTSEPLSPVRMLAIRAFFLGIPAPEMRRLLAAIQAGRVSALSARDQQLVAMIRSGGQESAPWERTHLFARAAAVDGPAPPVQPEANPQAGRAPGSGEAVPARPSLPLTSAMPHRHEAGLDATTATLTEAELQAAREQRLLDACIAGLADVPAFAGWAFLGCGQGHIVFDTGEAEVLKISREYRDTVRQAALFRQPVDTPPLGATLLRVRADIEAYNGRVDRLTRHVGPEHIIPERRTLVPNHPFPARILNVEIEEGTPFADGEVVNLPLVLVRQPKFEFGPEAIDFRLPHWYELPEFDDGLDAAGYARVNRMLMAGEAPFDADFFLHTQAGPSMQRLLTDARGDAGLRDAAVEFAIAMLDYEEEVLDFGGPLNAVLERQDDGGWRYMLVGVLMENDSVVTERDGLEALRKASDGDALDWREHRNLLYFINARRALHAIVQAFGVSHHRPMPADLAGRELDWDRVRQAARKGWPNQQAAAGNSTTVLTLPRAPWGAATYRHAAS